ncbi:MAG TPA: heme NO-binding domain-containing protein [Anaerolineae bacterium]|nr:heme NO-binding domain-containing protein [Anaerolineae bacterium]
MYGLVNKAIHDMVCENFGEDVWEQIRQKAGVEEETFISMETYPDAVTYQLVGAASDVLDTPATDILQAFGRYWTVYTAEEGYGDLLNMSGHTIQEFLSNLDEMHTRVSLSFPQLEPPSFECTEVTDESLNLHYYSHREGLAHLVIGLLYGLGERFKVGVEVEQTADRNDGADHDIFAIKLDKK